MLLQGYTDDVAGQFSGRNPNELLLTADLSGLPGDAWDWSPNQFSFNVIPVGVSMVIEVLGVRRLTFGAYAISLGQTWVHGPDGSPPPPPAVPDGTYMFTVSGNLGPRGSVFAVTFATAVIRNLPVNEIATDDWGEWYALSYSGRSRVGAGSSSGIKRP
jgi:hypothetical protein